MSRRRVGGRCLPDLVVAEMGRVVVGTVVWGWVVVVRWVALAVVGWVEGVVGSAVVEGGTAEASGDSLVVVWSGWRRWIGWR